LPVEIAYGDLDDGGSLMSAAEGCDTCIHLAGVSGWSLHHAAYLESSIVGGTERLVAAVRASGVRKLVYVSSTAAVAGSRTPTLHDEQSVFSLASSGLSYAIAKWRAEQLVLASAAQDFEVVVVNPAEVYGPNDDDWITAGTIRDVVRSPIPLVVRGGTSIVHVDDVASGIVGALQRGRSGHRYILGGENLTLAEIASHALAIAGIRRRVVVVPFAALRLAVRSAQILGLPPPVQPALLGYLNRYWFMNSTKARLELGFAPRSARATLEPVVQWICKQTPAVSPHDGVCEPAR